MSTDQALARTGDPTTSHEAARKVTEKLPNLEAMTLLALRILVKGTSLDAANWLIKHRGFGQNAIISISPRFKPLETNGLIRKTGERKDNRNVYELTEAAW